VKQPAVTF
jgi:hypothetical protein